MLIGIITKKYKYMKEKKFEKSPQEKLSCLTVQKNKKVLCLRKAEKEKSYIVKKIERLPEKKFSEMQELYVKLQKKTRRILRLTNDIKRINKRITILKACINKS